MAERDRQELLKCQRLALFRSGERAQRGSFGLDIPVDIWGSFGQTFRVEELQPSSRNLGNVF